MNTQSIASKKKKGLKQQILTYLRTSGDYVHKGTIETLAKNGEFGKTYLGETADRRARELVEEGKAEKHPEREGYYRAVKKEFWVKNVFGELERKTYYET